MKRNIQELSNREFDVVIIGAGMFGACALWEAAHRGLSAVLIEKGDFCQATSANHFKMVHGGIRYLQHGDVIRIRESSRERSAFLRVAPHLVKPLPIVIPTYGHGMKGKELLRAGMYTYDLVTADRNNGIKDYERKIPISRFISKNELLQEFPGVKQDGLTGAAIFNDAQMYNPPRLALSFIHSAVKEGASAVNYLEAINLIKKDGRVSGVIAKDLVSDNEIEIRGKIVLNTLGPWADEFLEKSVGIKLAQKPAFSRDAAFVIKRKPKNNFALATTLKTKDVDALFDRGGRHVFVVPWMDRDFTLIGVWHIVWGESKDNIFVTEKELENFIAEVNEADPEMELTKNDVSMINSGLTLFGETTPGSTRMSFGKRSLLIDHSKSHSVEGLISLIGVRATIARGMSEKMIELAAQKIGKKISKSYSEVKPVYGGEVGIFEETVAQAFQNQKFGLKQETVRALLHNHGSEYNQVLKILEKNSELKNTFNRSHVIKAEVINAIQNEMAIRLADVVFRRTDLGTAGDISESAVNECAELMANELSWSKEKLENELTHVKSIIAKFGSVKNYESRGLQEPAVQKV